MASPLATLWTRVMLMLARGVITAVKSDGKLQTLTIELLAGETREGVEHFEGYGYTSSPPPGMEYLAGFIGGDRGHGIVIAVADRLYRLKGLAGGEVAIYDDLGQKVHLKREGIDVESPSAITLKAPLITLDGAVHITGVTQTGADVNVTGTLAATVDVTFAGKSGIAHGHLNVENGPGVSGPPA